MTPADWLTELCIMRLDEYSENQDKRSFHKSYDDRLTPRCQDLSSKPRGFKKNKNSLRLKTPEYDESPFLKYKGKAMNKNTKIKKDDFIYFFTYLLTKRKSNVI